MQFGGTMKGSFGRWWTSFSSFWFRLSFVKFIRRRWEPYRHCGSCASCQSCSEGPSLARSFMVWFFCPTSMLKYIILYYTYGVGINIIMPNQITLEQNRIRYMIIHLHLYVFTGMHSLVSSLCWIIWRLGSAFCRDLRPLTICLHLIEGYCVFHVIPLQIVVLCFVISSLTGSICCWVIGLCALICIYSTHYITKLGRHFDLGKDICLSGGNSELCASIYQWKVILACVLLHWAWCFAVFADADIEWILVMMVIANVFGGRIYL